jgi:hypothetical protein
VARSSSADAKPLVSRGYGKIVSFTLLAMLIGCGLMGYEIFVEYGGTVQATKGQPPKVPATLPPIEKGGSAPAPGPGPVVPPAMP